MQRRRGEVEPGYFRSCQGALQKRRCVMEKKDIGNAAGSHDSKTVAAAVALCIRYSKCRKAQEWVNQGEGMMMVDADVGLKASMQHHTLH